VVEANDEAQRRQDVEAISYVINYDVRQDPDWYVHRVGRTARAGQTGEAITFMSPAEIGDVRAIEYHIGRELPRVELEGYGFGLATPEGGATAPDPKAARASRGFRMGSRAGQELSPEQLAELLRVG